LTGRLREIILTQDAPALNGEKYGEAKPEHQSTSALPIPDKALAARGGGGKKRYRIDSCGWLVD